VAKAKLKKAEEEAEAAERARKEAEAAAKKQTEKKEAGEKAAKEEAKENKETEAKLEKDALEKETESKTVAEAKKAAAEAVKEQAEAEREANKAAEEAELAKTEIEAAERAAASAEAAEKNQIYGETDVPWFQWNGNDAAASASEKEYRDAKRAQETAEEEDEKLAEGGPFGRTAASNAENAQKRLQAKPPTSSKTEKVEQALEMAKAIAKSAAALKDADAIAKDAAALKDARMSPSLLPKRARMSHSLQA